MLSIVMYKPWGALCVGPAPEGAAQRRHVGLRGRHLGCLHRKWVLESAFSEGALWQVMDASAHGTHRFSRGWQVFILRRMV